MVPSNEVNDLTTREPSALTTLEKPEDPETDIEPITASKSTETESPKQAPELAERRLPIFAIPSALRSHAKTALSPPHDNPPPVYRFELIDKSFPKQDEPDTDILPSISMSALSSHLLEKNDGPSATIPHLATTEPWLVIEPSASMDPPDFIDPAIPKSEATDRPDTQLKFPKNETESETTDRLTEIEEPNTPSFLTERRPSNCESEFTDIPDPIFAV